MRDILPLTFAVFSFSTGSFVFSGVLDHMAISLASDVPRVAQLQTIFAVCAAIGGPLFAFSFRGFSTERLFLAAIFSNAILNTASAFADSVLLLSVLRGMAGFLGAVTLPFAVALAIRKVDDSKKGAAVAMVVSGTVLALLIGVPMGSVVGRAFGWEASFVMAAIISSCAFLACFRLVFYAQGGVVPGESSRGSLTRDSINLVVFTFLSFSAIFCTAGFVGPIIIELTAVDGPALGLFQASVGIGGLLGLVVGGRLSSRGVKALPTLVSLMLSSQVALAATLALEVDPIFGRVLTPVMFSVAAMSLFACIPIVQSTLAYVAAPVPTLALAVNSSMVFAGQGVGIFLGGLAVSSTASLTFGGVAGGLVGCLTLFMAFKLAPLASSHSVSLAKRVH